jgi:hypothetical protein
MNGLTPPKKEVKINESYNAERIDSGNYPKIQRQNNSYDSGDFNNFRRDQLDEAFFNRAQNAIYTDGTNAISPPDGPQIISNLKKLEQYRRWGGLSKKMRSRKNRRTKRTRKNKHRKTIKK